MSTISQKSREASASPTRIRFHYLDGMRGIAALYVVLHHAYMEIAWLGGAWMPGWLRFFAPWIRNGEVAVSAFIVLSGYSLMLPVARAGDLRLPGGIAEFVKRGRLSPATASSANTRPSAAGSGTSSAPRREKRARIRSRASSTVSMLSTPR